MKLIRCISASAGTGKTYRINSIISSLVDSGVNPSSILCITFTKHTANEMERRYYSSIETQAGKPHFKTIHSFANYLLDEKLNIMDEEEQEDIIKEAVEIVCTDSKWMELFKCSEYEFGNIISDTKYLISNNLINTNSAGVNKILEKYSFQKIDLLKKCKDDLIEANLKPLLDKILSNDYEIYQTQIVTKNHKINKRLIPDSFMNNPKYAQTNRELQKTLKNILNMVVNRENNEYLKESAMINLFIKKVYEKYKLIKKTRELADYSDIISTSLNNINLEKIMNISHIFLDEAQDTTPEQWNFIMSILNEVFQKEEVSFTIVGDEKQIIYQFNGSSENQYYKIKAKLKRFITSLNGTWIEENLDKSYRSPRIILDFIDSVMNTTKYPTKHDPASDKAGYIKIWEQPESLAKPNFQDWRIQEKSKVPKWINICIDEIKRLVGTDLLNENRKVEYSDITILISKRCQNTFALTEEVRKSGIPIKESPFYLIRNEMIQELLSIAEFSLNLENDLLLISILRGPFFKFSYEEIESICVDRESSVWEKMCDHTNPKIKDAFKKISNWVNFPKDVLGFYSSLIFHDEYGILIQKLFYDEVLLLWESVLEFVNRSSSLSEFVAHLKNSKKSFCSNRNGVSVSTIHSAKGRENHIIFLCTSQATSKKQTALNLVYHNILLLKGNYKLYKQAKNKDLLLKELESERLLYVALTRAKEQIYILPPGDLQNENSWYPKILQKKDLFLKNGPIYEMLHLPDLKKASKV